METLLRWLNKPKADDKSLLARFFHADRALAAVASELDSFDGRAEPDRCSRLVSRLRQGQDKVLSITSLIIEELLGDERDPRTFRAKFPEEVLQENLAGQLWFGAECLAAGSSIMNREQESKEMRPLAEAVTRSLNNVRYLLRDQCLRNNVPNSERLNLDKNDAATEQLYESLKRFDRLFAEFEWRYVSAMVQVKTKEEYEMQELICVLCSETLQRALKLGLLEQEQVDAFDPALMFSIPRLAIVSGLVIYPHGPLNMDMPAEQLSEMFRPFRSLLIKVREHLRNLNETELYYLERLLCTNEEISLRETLKSKEATIAPLIDNNNTKSSKYSDSSQDSENVDNKKESPLLTNSTSKLQHKSCKTTTKTKSKRRADSPSPAPSSSSSLYFKYFQYTPISSEASSPESSHSLTSTYTAGEESNGTTSPDSWMDDDDGEADNVHHDRCFRNADDDEVDEEEEEDLECNEDDANYADDDDSDIDNENCENAPSDYETDNVEEDEGNKSTNLYDIENVVDHIMNLELASADCATGYLISNTTLGNLLQPQEMPLTDNFIVSDSDLAAQDDCNDNMDVELPTTSSKAAISTEAQQDMREDQENQDNNNSTTIPVGLMVEDSDHSNQARRRRYFEEASQTGKKDYQQRSHRHHYHRHHHHHHHHRHHQHNHSTTTTSTSSATSLSSSNRIHHSSRQSHQNSSGTGTRHRTHSHPHSHAYHHHHHHQRRPHRHGGERQSNSNHCEECVSNTRKEENNVLNSKAVTSFGLDIETPSSSSSLLEDNKPLTVRSGGRMKFKNTENLLHRLFVCIAGVADQLQTNFAFDLRQILRSVFLLNMSPAQEELHIPEKAKENELFEFRASENDVIQESAGSSQSIYSAEEVNPEGDNQSQNSNCSSSSNMDGNRVYRHSIGNAVSSTTTATALTASNALQRQQIERSRSLDNQEIPTTPPTAATTTSTTQQRQQQHSNQFYRSRHHSTGSNTTPSSQSSSENNSPVCERSTTITTTTSSRRVSESNANLVEQPSVFSSSPPTSRPVVNLSPPAWIPDQKAPRCMSCNTPFTAFRRRHHCRNCGGVFCGVCSNTSAPLPKYGLTKAVRVCRACYVHELGGNTNINPQHHHHNHQQRHSHIVSQTNANNEPSGLRRLVTTTRAID